MGAITTAIGDGVLTFMWMFVSSMFGMLTGFIAGAIGVDKHVWASIGITTLIIFVFVFIFNIIAEKLGGASFNPTANAAFYILGLGGDSLFSIALRLPAQAAGAVGGVLAIKEVMPVQYKHMLGGPALRVDVHTGAIAEGVLTFLITFLVLLIFLKGPRNPLAQAFFLAVVTVIMVVSGAGYTGPSMNPVNAFGWAYLVNNHNTWDHFYVYWICPFIGAIFSAWTFQLVFPPPAPKQKKA